MIDGKPHVYDDTDGDLIIAYGPPHPIHYYDGEDSIVMSLEDAKALRDELSEHIKALEEDGCE